MGGTAESQGRSPAFRPIPAPFILHAANPWLDAFKGLAARCRVEAVDPLECASMSNPSMLKKIVLPSLLALGLGACATAVPPVEVPRFHIDNPIGRAECRERVCQSV